MITENDVIEVGFISRTHGRNGMLVFAPIDEWAYSIDEYGIPFVFVVKDSCYIPFRVAEWKNGGGKHYLKLEGIDSIEEAEEFVKESVYVHRRDAEELAEQLEETPDYEGYKIFDQNGGYVGTIEYLDDSTENALFYLEAEDEEAGEVIIPAADEWIIEIDDDAMQIRMNIPEGLVDVNRTRGVYDEDE